MVFSPWYKSNYKVVHYFLFSYFVSESSCEWPSKLFITLNFRVTSRNRKDQLSYFPVTFRLHAIDELRK